MDVVVDNKNYWGIEVDYVKVTAKYKNAVLAVGELKDGVTVTKETSAEKKRSARSSPPARIEVFRSGLA